MICQSLINVWVAAEICAQLDCAGPCGCGLFVAASHRLYQKLDQLMLLAEGHLMYYGKADQVGVGGVHKSVDGWVGGWVGGQVVAEL